MFNLDYIYDWSSHMSVHNLKHFENKVKLRVKGVKAPCLNCDFLKRQNNAKCSLNRGAKDSNKI